MHMADGRETPLSVATRTGLSYATVVKAIDTLVTGGLIALGEPASPGRFVSPTVVDPR